MMCLVKSGLDRDQSVAFSSFVIVGQENCALRQFDRDAVLDKFPLPEEEDPSRRVVIMVAAGGFAAVGLGLGLWPLLDMMNPDASALSMATTEVDLAPVAEGQAITVMWRGKPIFIRHRTKKEIEEAKAVPLDDLPDPLARNAAGSVPATARNTTAPAACAKGRRRRTWRSRLTPSSPTPKSRSAEPAVMAHSSSSNEPSTGV